MADFVRCKLIELHPVDCMCSRCNPFRPIESTAGDCPHRIWVTMAEDDPLPEGWKLPGIVLRGRTP